MGALLTTAVVLAVIVAYLWVGLRFAIPAYKRRLSREISKYRERYPSLVTWRDQGVDYRHCQTMASRESLWAHIAFWPVVEAALLVQRGVDRQIGDPHDLDSVYLKQRIADLEQQLGVGAP